MFAGHAYTGAEIHLDTPNRQVWAFLSWIDPALRTKSREFWRVEEIKPLARLYECEELLRDALYRTTQKDQKHECFDAFVLACETAHVLAACRILHRGYKGEGEDAIGSSLLPSRWTPAMAARLSIKWVWALSVAAQWADSTVRAVCPKGAEDQNYWRAVIGEFVVRVTTE
jgi:hypothetical protein